MFYVKERINEGMEVSVELGTENVFCTCPRCKREVPVNLNDFFGCEDFGLMDTAVCCDECSNDIRHGGELNEKV